jgi:hypothetical protein
LPRTSITESSTVLPAIHEKLSSKSTCTVWEYKAVVNFAQRIADCIPIMNVQALRENGFHLTTVPHYSGSRARRISRSTSLPGSVGITWEMPALAFSVQPSRIVDSTSPVRKVRISPQVPLYSPFEVHASDKTVSTYTPRRFYVFRCTGKLVCFLKTCVVEDNGLWISVDVSLSLQ